MVDGFLRKLKDAIVGPDSEQVDPDANYDDRANAGQFGNVRPASEDPYGDPADNVANAGQFGNVRPASEDPYGDPADNVADAGMFGNVRPASEDPYGDPADEEVV
ncbi:MULTISPECIES: translation initiation factor [unclassified Microcoleus]|uniref:translation initiation factor n=1 Tax=unclassified Microcoleus TaxID=2642155 RepID=UPI002FD4B92A